MKAMGLLHRKNMYTISEEFMDILESIHIPYVRNPEEDVDSDQVLVI